MTFYKIIQGDCLEVLPTLEDESVDLVISDPPFNVGKKYGNIFDDNKTWDDYKKFLFDSIEKSEKVLKGHGYFFMWVPVKHISKILREINWNYRIFACCKNFVQIKPTRIQYAFDPIIFWTKGSDVFKRRKRGALDRDWHIAQTSKWVLEIHDLAKRHPCPRPIDTVEYLISMTTKKEDIVLDPFLGSGTTIVACKELGRSCIGIEINPKYCQIAEERLRRTKVSKKLSEVFT